MTFGAYIKKADFICGYAVEGRIGLRVGICFCCAAVFVQCRYNINQLLIAG